MARPRCSRKEPKRLRSIGAIVRRLSMKTRAGGAGSGDLVCVNAASGLVPIIIPAIPAEPAMAAPEACFKNERRERENRFILELRSEFNVNVQRDVCKTRGASVTFSVQFQLGLYRRE